MSFRNKQVHNLTSLIILRNNRPTPSDCVYVCKNWKRTEYSYDNQGTNLGSRAMGTVILQLPFPFLRGNESFNVHPVINDLRGMNKYSQKKMFLNTFLILCT